MKAEFKVLIDEFNKLDLSKRFPTQQDAEKFEKLKADINNLPIPEIGESYAFSVDSQLDKIMSEFKRFYEKYDSSTELASKSRINEIVSLAYYGQYERSIYMAGVAKEKNIKEPYKTQILSQPANSCLQRYRQISQISTGLSKEFERIDIEEYFGLLKQVERSLLYQFIFFSTEAYMHNPKHTLSIYHRALAYLMQGEILSEKNNNSEKNLYEKACDLIDTIETPSDKMHYMQLQYISRISDEFCQMPMISEVSYEFKDILIKNKKKADNIIKEGGGHKPKTYYTIMPFVLTGAKYAASFATLAALLYGVIHVNGKANSETQLLHMLQNMYDRALGATLRGSADVANILSFHHDPGGLALLKDPGGLASPGLASLLA